MTDDPRKVVLWLIAEDMYNDAMQIDGRPFTGAEVAPILGRLHAAVMHLAITMENIRSRVEQMENGG